MQVYDKLVFIEANTTGTGMLALRKAAGMGWEPLFLTNCPDRYDGLRETGCSVLVCNTNSIPDIEQMLGSEIDRSAICGFATTSEFYIETIASLSQRYHLPGNSPQSIKTCRNKHMTRLRLAEAGIRQPEFAVVRSVHELGQAIGRIGFPCVIKPADDSGSNHVKLCRSREEAEQQIRLILDVQVNMRGQSTSMTALVEQYIDAPEYSVEMLCWQETMRCIGITEKQVGGAPFFVEKRHIFPAPLCKESEMEIRSAVESALQAVGFRNGAAHVEVKLTEQGCSIIEINARLAGGMIPELIRYTTGIDVLEQHIRCSVMKPEPWTGETVGFSGIQFLTAKEAGVLREVLGRERIEQLPGMRQLTITAKSGSRVRQPHNAYDRLGYVIVTGRTYEEVRDTLDRASEILEVRLEDEAAAASINP
ncbi:hypothetical protein ABD86_01765 [Paenibacillus alvei]|nr:hypothetical protein [Paenibacillus alvei]MBG9742718.1 hypothetical protein [Paenibacillus alvei]